MSEPNAQEPTMEEILASIRRIISEDEPAGEPPVAEAEPEPVVAAPEPEPEPEELVLTERAPEPAVETLGDLDVYPAAAPAPSPAPVFHGQGLVSDPVAATTASVFGQLAQHVAMPKEGRTLEDVVRELLNPLLRAWLDEHLPAIVQAKVEEEVERIARRRG